LLVVTTASAVNPTLYPLLPFNFLRDVAPVARLVGMVNLVVVRPSVPANTLAEFIAPVIEKAASKI
jgi:tripartite-type tricarboxylate transporter receptor subunit TctC